jgi:nucleotide-binding universal stress UspA family protein
LASTQCWCTNHVVLDGSRNIAAAQVTRHTLQFGAVRELRGMTRTPGLMRSARRPRPSVIESPSADRRFPRILLATDGRPILDATIARALELGPFWGASVRVCSTVRIYGHSGALPSERDWVRHRALVRDAVERLRGRGVDVVGDVVATRKPAREICDHAAEHGCDAIVMTAGRNRGRLVAGLLWSQEPQRVRRRARVPVFLVLDEG